MEDNKKDFSIMVFPSLEEKPIQFKISQTFLRYFFVLIVVAISTSFIFANNFFEYSRQVKAYEELLVENRQLNEKVMEFAQVTQELSQTIDNMELVDSSIRVMLENQDIEFNEEEIAKQLALNTNDNNSVAIGGANANESLPTRDVSANVLSSRSVLDRTLNQVESNLGNLNESVKETNESYEGLEKDVKDYTEVLEATPNEWPAYGPITSGFGYRSSPFGGGYDFHNGVDIGLNYNTKVYAPTSGQVIQRGYLYSYGYYLVIDHGKGFSTLYAHLNKFRVSLYDKVSRGDLIAYSGSSGKSTGPHLHYEVRVNGERQNPKDYLPKR
ncbi:MAG: M23 family metallopeptidase [Clostridia bacterium]